MQCSNCGQTDKVTIGAKQYCTHCGMVQGAAPSGPKAVTPQITRPRQMSDLSAAPATPVVAEPRPAVKPSPMAPATTPRPIISPPVPAQPTAEPNPAGQFHQRASASPDQILDLRQMAVATTTSEPSQPPMSIHETPPNTVKVKPAITEGVTTEAERVISAPLAAAVERAASRRDNAQATSQSPAISKFGGTELTSGTKPAPEPIIEAQSQLTPEVTKPEPTNVTILRPTDLATANPKLTAVPTAAPAPAPTALPNAVVTQVQSLAKTIPPVVAPVAEQAKLAPAKFKPVSTAAVLAAIAILAGYIWVNNYPKMSLHAAAGRAGIEASLPGYLPSNFSQTGPIQTNPGQITINFSSSVGNQALSLTQQRTTWDASSLLDNFVARAHDQYLAVQGQGLTVYLYGQNNASWVNHGIWYNITGNNRLSRDQLLKIVYSL